MAELKIWSEDSPCEFIGLGYIPVVGSKKTALKKNRVRLNKDEKQNGYEMKTKKVRIVRE